MKTTEEKIAIMQAYLDGQQVEFSPVRLSEVTTWSVLPEEENPVWDWDGFDYRIKPAEPRTKFFVEWADGYLSSSNFDTYEEAEKWASNTTFNAIVEFKEVV